MTQNSIKLSWSAEEVDEKLKSIMKNIHEACVQYGTEADGYVNYVKGANVAGFMKGGKGDDGARDSVRTKAIVQLQQKKGEGLKAFHLFSV